MYENMSKSTGTAMPYGGLSSGQPATIREAGPIDKATETLGYINQLDDLAANLRAKLYGRTPETAECAEKRPEPPCLEELMHAICQRSAMLVGEMQNILGRL